MAGKYLQVGRDGVVVHRGHTRDDAEDLVDDRHRLDRGEDRGGGGELIGRCIRQRCHTVRQALCGTGQARVGAAGTGATTREDAVRQRHHLVSGTQNLRNVDLVERAQDRVRGGLRRISRSVAQPVASGRVRRHPRLCLLDRLEGSGQQLRLLTNCGDIDRRRRRGGSARALQLVHRGRQRGRSPPRSSREIRVAVVRGHRAQELRRVRGSGACRGIRGFAAAGVDAGFEAVSVGGECGLTSDRRSRCCRDSSRGGRCDCSGWVASTRPNDARNESLPVLVLQYLSSGWQMSKTRPDKAP